MEKYLELDIALRLSEEASGEAVKWSKKLGQTGETDFVLDGKNLFPHLTVHFLKIPPEDLERLFKSIKKISRKFPPISLSSIGIRVFEGYIMVDIDAPEELKQLFKSIAEELKIENKGIFYYQPHITLARLDDSDRAKELARKINWNVPEFHSSALAVFQTGPHGTCRKLLKKFKFKLQDSRH